MENRTADEIRRLNFKGRKPAATPAEALWCRVLRTDTCWLWLGNTSPKGYGRVRLFVDHRKVSIEAHRLAWIVMKGEVPAGMTLDHLCRVRNCVNPDHMEVVTRAENVLRGNSFSAVNRRKTHCLNGHPFDEENTYLFRRRHNGRIGRACIACWKLRQLNRKPKRVIMERAGGKKRHAE